MSKHCAYWILCIETTKRWAMQCNPPHVCRKYTTLACFWSKTLLDNSVSRNVRNYTQAILYVRKFSIQQCKDHLQSRTVIQYLRKHSFACIRIFGFWYNGAGEGGGGGEGRGGRWTAILFTGIGILFSLINQTPPPRFVLHGYSFREEHKRSVLLEFYICTALERTDCKGALHSLS